MRVMLIAAAISAAPCAAMAQTAGAAADAAPAAAATVEAAPAASAAPAALVAQPSNSGNVLPANTKVFMTLDEELSSKRVEKGQTFRLTLSGDVMQGNYVVIPRGTPAFGEVTWKTGRAMFGKSGKMTIELRYVELNGQKIPLTGEYRQEGEGNTLAAVGAVVLSAPLMFVTGKSARIPKGRELTGYTRESLPFTMPAGTQ
ncbi:MAG: hypothetical protein J7500_08680 [Sphingomonas sp.]|uniref:hypothetical protein n=1 Tax=Sphingomonas sp. TaxID=28214 RepID=UPI001B2D81F3|nr:hypothetical protein [Sphingomonas sp.]MBO9622774.1 hypothetical protein [Sphingomonas sp.]